jgi:ABC-2 type transport system permease protein
MQGLLAIYRKDLGHFFVSPIAYAVVGVFVFFCSVVFNNTISQAVLQSAQMQMQGMSNPADLPGAVVEQYLMFVATMLLFVTPMLTMGVYSEERKRGTMELLMTSPVTDLQIVLGKFFASFTLLVIMLFPTAIGFAYILHHSEPSAPWRVLGSEYLGVLLLGGALLALGSFFSSLTESQLIAAMLTFGAILLLWVVDFGSQAASTALSSALDYLSVFRHYDDFTRGVIDTSNLIFYLSFIVLGIFLTVRSVDSMRWRRA